MTYRKTWFSYVLWMIYTMLCAVFLAYAGNRVCASCFPDGLERIKGFTEIPSDNMVQALGVVAIPAAAALYWMIRTASLQIRKKCIGRENICRTIEYIGAPAVLLSGIFLRIMRSLDYIQLQDAAEGGLQAYVNGMDYFDMAKVTAGGSAGPPAYGSACLYVSCLSFVLSFLGNKAASAIVFQALLQVVGLVLAYAATRKVAGRLPACVALLYLACSAGYLEMLKNLGPECLFFDLYMAGALAAFGYVKGYCANRLGRGQSLAGASAVGIMAGILGYLDVTAVTILLFMTAVATGKKKRPENAPAVHSPGTNAAVIAVAAISCAAGLFGLAGLVSLCRGTDFGDGISSWMALHIQNTQTFGFRPLYPYSLDMPLFGILAVLAAFLVFEFFRSGREQNYMLWILLCVTAAPTPLAVSGVQPFGLFSMYIWGVLAGLGLQNCIFGGKAELLKMKIEEISHTAAEIEKAETSEETAEGRMMKKDETAAARHKIKEDVSTEEMKQPEIVIDDKKTTEPGAEGILPQKPRYLENPLPLPRKHVRKQMDYQYSVDEKDMKYDVEIREGDDFDI